MSYTDIVYEERDQIAYISINRPDVMNAFRGQTVEEMLDAMIKAGWDKNIAAIVLGGTGERAFCTGGDQSAHSGQYDGRGTVGVIPTVTKPFCGDCDRVRLTADGQFRTCLFATTEFDLLKMIRSGASDDDLAAEIQRAVGTKWAGHQINQVTFVRPRRTMSQIGG